MRVASGAVEEEDGVVYVAGGIAVWLAEGDVFELEFGEGFAGAELEVLDDVGVVFDGPFWAGADVGFVRETWSGRGRREWLS